jgi:hypothetical protein
METFVNDTVQLTIDTNIDISGYATLLIRYRKPNGVIGCWTATICPTDVNCMYYICVDGDLDIPGEWLIQAQAKDVGVKLTGLWVSFQVHDPLSEFCTTVAPTTMVPTT